MPIPQKYQAIFVENGIYHVYNRTSNKQKLFLNDGNCNFFLKQYARYISPVAGTFCWNLLPNHFHLLIQLKTANEIAEGLRQRVSNLHKPTQGSQPSGVFNLQKVENPVAPLAVLTKTESRFLQNEITFDELIEFYFKSFFQSYSLAFNKVNNRKGNLFYKPFKRVEVHKEAHFTQTVIYIHANAQRHQLCKNFMEWQWSSWHSLLSAAPTQLKRNEVIEWFGGKEQMIKVHKEMTAYYYNCENEMED